MTLALAVALAGASAAQAATGAVILRTIAVGGEHAPGTPPDVTFFGALEVDFGTPPHIDRDGRVGFGAFLAGAGVEANDMGIWIERGGSLTLVMRNGGQAPGLPPGVTFATTGFFPLVPAVAAGRTAFFSIVSGPARGLFKETGGGKETDGGLALVHLDGTQAPGLAPGIALNLPLAFPFLNDAGQVSFFGALSGSGVTQANDESIWSDRSGVLGLVVREGQPAPGTDAVFGAGSYLFAPPGGLLDFTFNEQSRLLLYGSLAAAGIDEFNDEGLWVEGPGGLELLAREGQQAPGLPAGVEFGGGNGIDAFDFVPIVLGSSGAALFQARVAGADVNATGSDTLWTNRSGALELVALGRIPGAVPEGDPAPGFPPGTSFTGFTQRALINAANRIAFVGVVEGPQTDGDVFDFGVWSDRRGALELVVGDGLPVPDLHPGVVFGVPASISNKYGLVDLTDGGDVLFAAELSGAVPPETRGLFVSDRDGDIHTLLRTNDVVDLDGDGSNPNTLVDFLVGGVSRTGETVVKLLFADGTIAIATVRFSAPQCDGDADCDDGLFCNGEEVCGTAGTCEGGSAPCDASRCDETNDECVAAADPAAQRCTSAKLKAAGRNGAAELGCHARAASKGVPVDVECLAKAEEALVKAFGKAEARGGCLTANDAGAVEGTVDRFVQPVAGALPAGSTRESRKCAVAKLKAAGEMTAATLGCHARAASKGVPVDIGCLAREEEAFVRAFGSAERKGGCASVGDADDIEQFVDGLVSQVVTQLAPRGR